jgi:hypothetical protein
MLKRSIPPGTIDPSRIEVAESVVSVKGRRMEPRWNGLESHVTVDRVMIAFLTVLCLTLCDSTDAIEPNETHVPKAPIKVSPGVDTTTELPLIAPYPREAFLRMLEQPFSLGYNDYILVMNELIASELGLGLIQREFMIELKSSYGAELEKLIDDIERKTETPQESSKKARNSSQHSAFQSLDDSQRNLLGERIRTVQRRYAATAVQSLTELQRQRLNQIKLRLAGTYLFRIRKFQDYLGLSGEQNLQVERIFRTHGRRMLEILKQKRRQNPRQNLEALFTQANARAFEDAKSVLTPNQLRLLNELMGEPLGFSPHELSLRIDIPRSKESAGDAK